MRQMQVIVAQPPVWDALIQAGYDTSGGCVFTWGNLIYNPDGRPVDDALVAHESRHSEQQDEVGGPEEWWRRWILDPAFRAEQEAQAYGVQYKYACGIFRDRNVRAKYLHKITSHFCSGMYMLSIKQADARAAILKRAGL